MALFRKQENVPINRLKPAHYNPPRRMQKDALYKLMNAMQSLDGIIYPIVVDNEYNIIEGHRRWAAARHLKWKTVDVIKMTNGHDRNLIYALVNDTSSKLSGNDKIGIWLKEPNAVTQTLRSRLQRISDEMGRDLIERLFKLGHSLRPVTLANEIANYCSMQGMNKTIILWLLKHEGSMGKARQAMTEEINPATLRKAIEENRPLKFKME